MKTIRGQISDSGPEVTEDFVTPPLSAQQRKEALESVAEYRQKSKMNVSLQERQKSQLLQLRYLMEDYIKTLPYDTRYYFGYFLQEYISRLGRKNKEFAEEIGIEPTELSQLINRHRYPNDKIIVRLELHSNKNFPAIMWFRLLEKEKSFELLNNIELRNAERVHIKHKLDYSL